MLRFISQVTRQRERERERGLCDRDGYRQLYAPLLLQLVTNVFVAFGFVCCCCCCGTRVFLLFLAGLAFGLWLQICNFWPQHCSFAAKFYLSQVASSCLHTYVCTYVWQVNVVWGGQEKKPKATSSWKPKANTKKTKSSAGYVAASIGSQLHFITTI